MGWILILVTGALVLLALWKWGGIRGSALQLLAAALLVAFAGYAWQGSPGFAGRPVPARAQTLPPVDTAFADSREAMLGQFDYASRWLTIAEAYQRSGDTAGGADIIRAGLRASPQNADLWVGLGNALVMHANGLMTPAAELAFRRAETIAPEHPGPKFFYGLALAQGGKFDEAERLWRGLLASAPADVSWRPMVEERLAQLDEARMMGGMPPPAG